MDDPAYQKALILRMLTPNISDAVVNIRNSTLSDKAVSKDYFYKENMLNEPVMSLMAKISTGERNGNKTFAKEVLRDLNNLKNVAYLQTRFPNANRELLLAKMYTEPASLEGSMTKDLHLGQKVYEAANAKDEILRNAAKFIIDAAQSKGLVDPVLLYRASLQMRMNGIEPGQQWGRIKYLKNADGTLVNHGYDRILISDQSSIKHSRNLGERGGVEESTVKQTEEKFNCYK